MTKFTGPENKPRDPASGTTTSAPATLGEKNRQKFYRAADRLARGQALFQLPGGQYKFGGNKFVPGHVAQRLIAGIEPTLTNRGWLCFAPPSINAPTPAGSVVSQARGDK